MASYRARLERDLDRWVHEGLITTQARAAILTDLPPERRIEMGTALATLGGLLAGIAVIAFVAANWGVIPRIARFGLILTTFLALAGTSAWAAKVERPLLSKGLLMVAALVFAGAIGLTGQIFDLAGDPQMALRGAGLAALILGLAGNSTPALLTGLVFVGLGDFAGSGPAPGYLPVRGLAFAAPLGLILAALLSSRALAHAASIGLIIGFMALKSDPSGLTVLASCALFAAGAAVARWRREDDSPTASTVYGWLIWGTLIAFGLSGFDDHGFTGLPHRAVWLMVSGGVLTLGLNDRQPLVTAAGVISLMAAMAAILFDLGVGLMTAAGVFGACALVALVTGLLISRRQAGARP